MDFSPLCFASRPQAQQRANGSAPSEFNDLQKQVSALTRELAEAREQQSATPAVPRVISSSPGALGSVFQAILENATHICEAKFGNLFQREGDAIRVAATQQPRVKICGELATESGSQGF